MYYSELYKRDFVNGDGCRCTLFVSGCDHHCKGCFNQKTWRPDYGTEYTTEFEESLIHELNQPMITGLTLLGGDPLFSENIPTVLKLMQRVKAECPNRDIWLWTGYTLEQMQNNMILAQCLPYIDTLIDGKFVEEKKDLTLKHRGSSNQRILKRGVDY